MARVDCIKERSRCDEKSLEGLTLSIKSITSLSKKKRIYSWWVYRDLMRDKVEAVRPLRMLS